MMKKQINEDKKVGIEKIEKIEKLESSTSLIIKNAGTHKAYKAHTHKVLHVIKWMNKIVKSLTITKAMNSVINYARASIVGTTLLYHFFKYAFLGDYDQRVIDVIQSLSRKSPMYVKIFQALAGSTGILSEKVQKYLIVFSDNVPFTDDEESAQELFDYLDKIGEEYPEYKITEISLQPVHSGTVSLVYEGLMKDQKNINDDGTQVVMIKYVRNGIKEKMIKAVEDTEYLIKILNMIPSVRAFNLSWVLKENRKLLLEQTSMRVEMNNMNDLLSKTQGKKERDYVKIPKPYDVYTENNDNVLVMEKIEGKRIEDVSCEDKEAYGLMIARNTVDTIMIDGLYHGDLHRGNVLFLENNGVKQIGLLDFGIIGRLSECERLTISSFFISLGMKRYDDVINNLLGSYANKESIDRMDKKKYEDMITDLVDIAETACVSRDGFGSRELTQINNLVVKNGLVLDPIFCVIEMSIAMSSTVCKELDTKHRNFMSYLHEVIQEKMDLTLFDDV